MDNDRGLDSVTGSVLLEHLTGPSRGRIMWLKEEDIDVCLSSRGILHALPARSETRPEGLVARLSRNTDTYEIEAPKGARVWVNGQPVTRKLLRNGDMIEFGENGPLSRYFLLGEEKPIRKTVGEIVGDVCAYLQTSRQPLAKRVFRAICALLRRIVRETTILFRGTIVIAIVALAAGVYHQGQKNRSLQERIERSESQLDEFSTAIARASEQALRARDLEALRREFGGRLATNAERLAALEKRLGASARVIAQTMPSVFFLQGAYSFRERSSKRMLRLVVDEKGQPQVSLRGHPMLSLEGDGPIAELEFTGTAFAVGEAGALITSRHVALPWEEDDGEQPGADQNLEPVLIKFIAYQPGKPDPVAVELLQASKDADLAILKIKDAPMTGGGLRLAEAAPNAGDEVIVMGYPTGLVSMLAQSGETFIENLQKSKDTGFWSVAARLAKAGYIMPLASRGIVARSTDAAIVYDAETTHGGSGGPVLDLNGSVVAVNMATLPGYGGSNLGVPAAKLRALLKSAGLY